MGIKGLLPLLRELYPKAFKKIPISKFNGLKIAIDIDIIIYKFYAIAYEQMIIPMDPFKETPDEEILANIISKRIIEQLGNRYITNNITPIIVTSGSAPPEKDECERKRRKALKTKSIEVLEANAKKYIDTKPDIFAYSHHTKLRCRTATPSPETIKSVIKAIEEKGYMVLPAVCESEELCAQLCVEDRVQAVFSTDSDNLVRRCPITITEFIDEEDGTYVQTMIYSTKMLKAMDMTYEQFLDLCILLQCDYNTKIRGMGPGTALNLILEYGSIEAIGEIEKYKNKIGTLNHVRCREIFNINSQRTSEDCCSDHFSLSFLK